MKPPSYKLIDPNEIKPGDHFEGYEGHTNSNGTRTSHFVQIEVGEDGVAREWGRNPVDMNKVGFFRKPLTWEERDAWYKSAVDMTQGRNQLNLMGLHNDMYQVGDARHEMWNGWIQTSWEEQLIELLDEDFLVLSIRHLPVWVCRCAILQPLLLNMMMALATGAMQNGTGLMICAKRARLHMKG